MKRGVYRVCFKGLTLNEAWRLGGPVGFVIAMIMKFTGKMGDTQWLPAHEAEKACPEGDLSPDALEGLRPVIQEATRLGYSQGLFMKVVINVSQDTREAYAYHALHQDGIRSAYLAHVWSGPGQGRRVQTLTVGAIRRNLSPLQVVNHKQYLDDGGWSKIIRLEGQGLQALDARLKSEISSNLRGFKSFQNIEEFRALVAQGEAKIWDGRIRRGLFVKVSSEEEKSLLEQRGLTPAP